MFCVTAGNIHLGGCIICGIQSHSPYGETKQKWAARGIWAFLDHRTRVGEEQPHKGVYPTVTEILSWPVGSIVTLLTQPSFYGIKLGRQRMYCVN